MCATGCIGRRAHGPVTNACWIERRVAALRRQRSTVGRRRRRCRPEPGWGRTFDQRERSNPYARTRSRAHRCRGGRGGHGGALERLPEPVRPVGQPRLQGEGPPGRAGGRPADGCPVRPGPQRWRLGGDLDRAPRPRGRVGRRGDRARVHVRGLHLVHRVRRRHADPGRGGRVVRPRPGRRRGEDHAAHQGDHRGPHARRACQDDRDQGRRRPARDPDHRGLRAGLRRHLRGPGRRQRRRHRDLQLQRVQDDHLRRRRDARHRRRGPVRALLRDSRPGSRAVPARVQVRPPAVPGHELPDDRAVGCRPAGAAAQARRGSSPTSGPTRRS